MRVFLLYFYVFVCVSSSSLLSAHLQMTLCTLAFSIFSFFIAAGFVYKLVRTVKHHWLIQQTKEKPPWGLLHSVAHVMSKQVVRALRNFALYFATPWAYLFVCLVIKVPENMKILRLQGIRSLTHSHLGAEEHLNHAGQRVKGPDWKHLIFNVMDFI